MADSAAQQLQVLPIPLQILTKRLRILMTALKILTTRPLRSRLRDLQIRSGFTKPDLIFNRGPAHGYLLICRIYA